MTVEQAELGVFHAPFRKNRCNMTSRNQVMNVNTGATMKRNTIPYPSVKKQLTSAHVFANRKLPRPR
jgi:hypothetical protein